MTTISVLSPTDAASGYRAVADGVEARGETPGRALDALVEQTGPPPGATLVVIQPRAGDEFFSDAQRQRLAELMSRWRATRDTAQPFPPADQAELDGLIAEELKAAIARSAALLRTARP
ncbi:MAG: hypothetical protein J0I06_19670 [Planctomycetes bacterium]|nr:hypothetical protein [Planctomycetota bacterium]